MLKFVPKSTLLDSMRSTFARKEDKNHTITVHEARDKSRFSSLIDFDGEVSFGDNSKAQIAGKGCVGRDQLCFIC